jgi:hypothetical protein
MFKISVSTMEGMVESLLDEDTKKLFHNANSTSIDCNQNNRIFSLVRTAHALISEVASQPGNDQWKDELAPHLENQKLVQYETCQRIFIPHTTWYMSIVKVFVHIHYRYLDIKYKNETDKGAVFCRHCHLTTA